METVYVRCAECAIIAPVDQMQYRAHYGGFWRCENRGVCEVRFHLAICHDDRVRAVFPDGSTSCVFCMAGTSHQRFSGSALIPRPIPGTPRRRLPSVR